MDGHWTCSDLTNAAQVLAGIVKTQLRDFRRPIRYTVSSADGTICANGEDGMEVILGPSPLPVTTPRMMRLPLHILFIDADGREFTALIDKAAPVA